MMCVEGYWEEMASAIWWRRMVLPALGGETIKRSLSESDGCDEVEEAGGDGLLAGLKVVESVREEGGELVKDGSAS